MFCKWCGVKRKTGERVCSNCNTPFEPLITTGVPDDFLRINSENNCLGDNDFSDEDNNGNENENQAEINDDTDKRDDNIKKRYNDLKCVLLCVIIFFIIIIILLFAKIGQLMKKDVNVNGNIDTRSEIVSETEKTISSTAAVEAAEDMITVSYATFYETTAAAQAEANKKSSEYQGLSEITENDVTSELDVTDIEGEVTTVLFDMDEADDASESSEDSIDIEEEIETTMKALEYNESDNEKTDTQSEVIDHE